MCPEKSDDWMSLAQRVQFLDIQSVSAVRSGRAGNAQIIANLDSASLGSSAPDQNAANLGGGRGRNFGLESGYQSEVNPDADGRAGEHPGEPLGACGILEVGSKNSRQSHKMLHRSAKRWTENHAIIGSRNSFVQDDTGYMSSDSRQPIQAFLV